MNIRPLRRIALAATLLVTVTSASAQGTAFTYQGRLNDGSAPASGSYDLIFTLQSAANGAAQVGGVVTKTATAVSNGLFTVSLNFGDQFPGADRWLEIGVKTNGAGGFTTLTPRQALAATPHAITAGNLSGTLPAGGLAGTYGGALILNNAGNSFSGNGGNLTGLNASQLSAGTVPASALGNAWKTTGNAGANPTNDAFLGTTDSLPLEFKVNGLRALRIEPTENGRPNIIGGNAANSVAAGVQAATIAGGSLNFIRTNASYSTIAGGESNEVGPNSFHSSIGGGQFNEIAAASFLGTIAGGSYNRIGSDSSFSAIGGGFDNDIGANSSASVVGGGNNNNIGANASASVIGGGDNNNIEASSRRSTIAGGQDNKIAAGSFYATISGGYHNAIGTNSSASVVGGGDNNNIGDNSSASTIGGGYQNKIAANSQYVTIAGGGYNSTEVNSFSGTIGGGNNNTIAAISSFATIPGGYLNFATTFAFAAGTRAKANHPGAFVWADSQNADFASTTNDQFNIRAQGGVRLNTDTSMSFGNQPRQMLNLYSNTFGIGIQASTLYFRCQATAANDGFMWYRGGVHNDGYLQAGTGGTELMHLVQAGLYVTGTFVSSSDRNIKENFKPVDARAVLDKVAALPLSEWNYKADTASRHLGPMAQDFYAAFAVGPDDKHITTVDEGGVALAAIQGLNQKHEAEVKSKDARIRELEARLEKLEHLMEAKGTAK